MQTTFHNILLAVQGFCLPIFPNSVSLLYMVIYSLNKADFIITTKVI